MGFEMTSLEFGGWSLIGDGDLLGASETIGELGIGEIGDGTRRLLGASMIAL